MAQKNLLLESLRSSHLATTVNKSLKWELAHTSGPADANKLDGVSLQFLETLPTLSTYLNLTLPYYIVWSQKDIYQIFYLLISPIYEFW